MEPARSESVWFLLKKIEPGLRNESPQFHQVGNIVGDHGRTTDPVLIITTIGRPPQRAVEMMA
jgi:hypothetical protein